MGPDRKLKTRQEAKQETRQALLRAGLEAFLDEGVDQPSLDAICARAGYTRGAFYVHFKDRDDFLLAVINEALSAFIDSIIATGTKGEDLEKTIDLFTQAAGMGAMLPTSEPRKIVNIRVLLEAGSRIPEIERRFADLIQDAITRLTMAVEDAQKADAARNDIEAGLSASILVAAAIGIIVMVETNVKIDLAGIRQAAFKLLLDPNQ